MKKISSFFVFLIITNGPFLFAMNNSENDAKSSALSDNDSEACSSDGFEPERPFPEWAKNLDLENFPDPNLFPVLDGVLTEEAFREVWQQKTGLVIKNFSAFTIPQGS